MADPLIWLTEQDVVSLVLLDDAIPALERGLAALGKGEAFNVPKALGSFGDGSSMHSLASGAPGLGYVGFKNWVHTKRGATALYMLFNSADASDVHRIFPPANDSAVGFAISPKSHHAVSTVHGGERFTLVFSFYGADFS